MGGADGSACAYGCSRGGKRNAPRPLTRSPVAATVEEASDPRDRDTDAEGRYERVRESAKETPDRENTHGAARARAAMPPAACNPLQTRSVAAGSPTKDAQ